MAFNWNPFSFARKKESNQDIIADNNKLVNDQLLSGNENYKIFKDVSTDIERIVSMRSVVDQQAQKLVTITNPTWQTELEGGVLVLPAATNKKDRLNQYRSISKFTECDWCLDEICDDFIHEDEDQNFIKLKLPEGLENLNDTRKDILQNEFAKYIELFRFKDDGFNLVKRFLIEGELAWENVINHEHPDLGIIGVKFLPSDYYETLVDTKTNKAVGIYFDVKNFSKEQQELLATSYYSASSQIFNAMINTGSYGYNREDCVVFLWPQVTYINSGDRSADNLITFPLIEKTKQAYHQLALLQDAAVILRVTRAPERLLFNVSTGKMTQNYADSYIRQFAQTLKSKKVATTDGKDIASVYNPVSMLESYIFGKSDGNDGTSIESVGSSASYDEIADIEYFLRRLMKQFKVPFTRYKTPENTMERDESISYEEYSFTRMIVRLQRRFAKGFKDGFITHLKLREIWDKYHLTESDIDVSFVKPVLFDLYQTQKLMETKMNIYKSIVDNDEMSKIIAMKKYLDFTDADIEENFKHLAKEKMLMQYVEFAGGKVDENGLGGVYQQLPLPLGGSSEDGEGGDDSEPAGDDGAADDAAEDAAEESSKEPEEPTFGLG